MKFWRRWLMCARYDCRWRILRTESGQDIRLAVKFLLDGLVCLSITVIHIGTLVLRWPCKPLGWAWVAWNRPDYVEELDAVRKRKARK